MGSLQSQRLQKTSINTIRGRVNKKMKKTTKKKYEGTTLTVKLNKQQHQKILLYMARNMIPTKKEAIVDVVDRYLAGLE